MRVIGVDVGTATVGWAITETVKGSPKLVAVEYGAIITSPKQPDEQRLEEIHTKLSEIVTEYCPNEAAVESLFFFQNQKTIMTVSQARGVILLSLKLKGLPISSYTPLQVKSAVTGYGRAEKKQVQQMVKAIYGLKQVPQPDDVADALAICVCHLNSGTSLL